MAVSSATLLHDSVVYFRDLLLNNVTDPKTSQRPSGYKFCMTSFPERRVFYPIVTVGAELSPDYNLGMRSENSMITVNITVRIYSKSTKERDELADAVYDFLRGYQLGTSETIDTGLYNFRLVNMTPMDEPGPDGIHQMIIEFRYEYVTV
jgi:hypothetical protein